ncbi:hypothetical protein IEO21_03194 [Rhodonia placenta]|uniref:RING-type domain-containing protein n=1 Tax=Rhodonia placenta TaxID=104341 RepID=A0A8H7U3S5_9APHY|nr:hypothetical protein IEO21_03194 [Postia placenta]
MNSRCSICLETLGEGNSPMTTLCGHLYCVDCATYNFASDDATCAICRRPHTLDELIKLYPDYERAKEGPSTSTGRLGVEAVGNDLLEACRTVLQKDAVLDEAALRPALARADHLVEELSEHEDDAPYIPNLLSNIIEVLTDIRSKFEQASCIPALEADRDKYRVVARKLSHKFKEAVRSREAERLRFGVELAELRAECSAQASELQTKLQETSSALATDRAKLEASFAVAKELDAQMKQCRTQAARYKKKYYALRKEHDTYRNGVEDAFFADDTFEIVD